MALLLHLLSCSAAVLLAATSAASAAEAGARKNLLFFIADDLRPQLNKAYGLPFMHTPHFDAFADTALTFDHAYTNFGICSASRNSFVRATDPAPLFSLNSLDPAPLCSHASRWLTELVHGALR
jgi:hypothetical protein